MLIWMVSQVKPVNSCDSQGTVKINVERETKKVEPNFNDFIEWQSKDLKICESTLDWIGFEQHWKLIIWGKDICNEIQREMETKTKCNHVNHGDTGAVSVAFEFIIISVIVIFSGSTYVHMGISTLSWLSSWWWWWWW